MEDIIPRLNLKEIRKKFGKTQREMAAHIGCTTRCYQMYESGSQSFPNHRNTLLYFLSRQWEKGVGLL
ncbi:MAG TPA: helix-turn-helix domain-containing protein [Candidatus Brocadiaceae bacterium]